MEFIVLLAEIVGKSMDGVVEEHSLRDTQVESTTTAGDDMFIERVLPCLKVHRRYRLTSSRTKSLVAAVVTVVARPAAITARKRY